MFLWIGISAWIFFCWSEKNKHDNNALPEYYLKFISLQLKLTTQFAVAQCGEGRGKGLWPHPPLKHVYGGQKYQMNPAPINNETKICSYRFFVRRSQILTKKSNTFSGIWYIMLFFFQFLDIPSNSVILAPSTWVEEPSTLGSKFLQPVVCLYKVGRGHIHLEAESNSNVSLEKKK